MTPKELKQIKAHPTFADIRPLLAEVERLKEEAGSFEYTQKAVSRIWKILGIETYKQAKGKSVDQLVQDRIDEVERLKKREDDFADLLASANNDVKRLTEYIDTLVE